MASESEKNKEFIRSLAGRMGKTQKKVLKVLETSKKSISEIRCLEGDELKKFKEKMMSNGYSDVELAPIIVFIRENRQSDLKNERIRHIEEEFDKLNKRFQEVCLENALLKQNLKVDLTQICSTVIPDLDYSEACSALGKTGTAIDSQESSTFVRNKHRLKTLHFLELDIESKFASFIAQYCRDKIFEPLSLLKCCLTIDHEDKMTSYLLQNLAYFFKTITPFSNPPSLVKFSHKNSVTMDLGLPDIKIICDERFNTFIEMKLDHKFVIPDGKTIHAFYNACQGTLDDSEKGIPKCNCFVCCAIYQVYCYMKEHRTQYGMLSTFERSWIFFDDITKDENGQFVEKLSVAGPYATSKRGAEKYPTLTKLPFLKLAFVLFSLAKQPDEVYQEYLNSIDRADEELDEENHATVQPKKNVDFQTPPFSKSPLPDKLPPLEKPDFSSVKDFQIVAKSFLGRGRSGIVKIGCVDGVKAAVKVADLYQMCDEQKNKIRAEMRNEAKILHYLNRCPYAHAPRLLYSGHWCYNVFYVVATEIIEDGVHKTRKELTVVERDNLDKAIDALHACKVVHNDLKWDNILFRPNGEVFIIDYGFAAICDKESVTNSDESNYRLN